MWRVVSTEARRSPRRTGRPGARLQCAARHAHARAGAQWARGLAWMVSPWLLCAIALAALGCASTAPVFVGGIADGGGLDGGGSVDGGSVDGGPVDGGPVDGGPVDGGALDAGTLDGGIADGGPTADAGLDDAGTTAPSCPGAAACSGRECGVELVCNTSCGSCNAFQTCTADGHCQCTNDAACSATMHCDRGACVPDVCAKGQYFCAANQRRLCNASGSQYAVASDCSYSCVEGACVAQCADDSACPADQYCNLGSCVPDQCTQGTYFCQGSQRRQCTGNGSASTLSEDCPFGCTAAGCQPECTADASCRVDQHCESGACTADVCAQGAAYCDGNQRRQCNDNGSASSPLQDCPFGCTPSACLPECATDSGCRTDQYCNLGACVVDVCAQGTYFCDGAQRKLCNANGSGSSIVETCGYQCQGGACVPAPACPSGNGRYCGGSVGRDSQILYSCASGSYTFYAYCGVSCAPQPPGLNDKCTTGTCPGGNGRYCGQSVSGLTAGTLYTCSNATYTVYAVCATGCVIAPAGMNDHCQ